MSDPLVRKAPLGWLLGGLLLGALQVAAVALEGPLGVSTQFVTADALALEQVAPEYVKDHALIGSAKARKTGYGWWLAIGIPIGAAAAAVATRRWRVRSVPVWWQVNHGVSVGRRLLSSFVAGVRMRSGGSWAGHVRHAGSGRSGAFLVLA